MKSTSKFNRINRRTRRKKKSNLVKIKMSYLDNETERGKKKEKEKKKQQKLIIRLTCRSWRVSCFPSYGPAVMGAEYPWVLQGPLPLVSRRSSASCASKMYFRSPFHDSSRTTPHPSHSFRHCELFSSLSSFFFPSLSSSFRKFSRLDLYVTMYVCTCAFHSSHWRTIIFLIIFSPTCIIRRYN